MTKKLRDDDIVAVSEFAWERLSQAIRTGQITIGERMDISLDVNSYIELCKWAAGVKVKKPQVVTPPEDFQLISTAGDDVA